MSFVIEKIPQEELARSDADQIGFNLKLWSRWAIDRDRDAFIVLTNKEGGPYEGTQVTEYYTLSWKNELIRIAADPLPNTYIEQGAVMHCRIRQLTFSDILQHQKDDVFQIVKEALAAVRNGHEYVAVEIEYENPD